MTSLGILRICFEKESAERAEGDNDNDNDNETARSAHQVTGEQTYPALCYHVPGTSVNAGEPPLVLYCSLASPLPTSPPMIQGETKWGTPLTPGDLVIATLLAEIGRRGRFEDPDQETPFVEETTVRAQASQGIAS